MHLVTSAIHQNKDMRYRIFINSKQIEFT